MLIGTFSLSLVVIVTMITIKWYEIKKQKEGGLSRVLARFDRPLEKYYEDILRRCEHVWDKVVLDGAEGAPKYFKEVSLRMFRFLSEKYNSALPNIRGTRKFRGDKDASLYLRDIHQHKEQNGKGRIEG